MIVTNIQFFILVVHELTPTVGGTGQEIVEALIILHQIRENMLHILLIEQLLGSIIFQRNRVVLVVR